MRGYVTNNVLRRKVIKGTGLLKKLLEGYLVVKLQGTIDSAIQVDGMYPVGVVQYTACAAICCQLRD